MSEIREQIQALRDVAGAYKHNGLSLVLREAADTIESLSAKLDAANGERAEGSYNGADNLIDRDKLIDDFLNHYLVKNDGTWNDAMDRAVELAKTAPKVNGGGWIPCKDRLPEKDGRYLATMDGKIYGQDENILDVCDFENGKWLDDSPHCQAVLAWMDNIHAPYHEP